MNMNVFHGKNRENLFLQSPMSYVQSLKSSYCDYMLFRYYASTMGRFLKPDNLVPDLTNPQNWNAYSYVKGNPINFNDPTGHEEKTFDMTNKPQGAGMSASNPITGEPEEEKEAVLPTDQPKKVGDEMKEPVPADGCNDTIEKVNPITGQPSVSLGEKGELGVVRCIESNPDIGKFGKVRNGGEKEHKGLDINAPEGTTVVAAAGGVITDVGERGIAGNRIQITLPDGTVTTYAHLKFADVSPGQFIKTGEAIGVSGTTGNARGLPKNQEHLHFAVTDPKGKRVDPFIWLNK